MEDIIILGIESSCDETACAIVKNGKEILSNVVATQIDVHKKFGGVLPEVASRIHVENISMIISEALEKAGITMGEIDAIAYTQGPGLIGSLHVGVQAAKTLGWAFNKPLVPIHHIKAHIAANNLIEDLVFPLLAVVVSGGHSEIVLMNDPYDYQILGQTQDDAIGEAYDKVSRVLGLGYPGGPVIDKLAKEGKPIYKLPKPHTQGRYDLSFSGLKSGVLQFIDRCKRNNETFTNEDLACSFQEVALDQIIDKVNLALEEYDVKMALIAGGVSANSRLREKMQALGEKHQVKTLLPPLWCCTDNAAMVGVEGYFQYLRNNFGDFSDSAKASMKVK